MASSSTRLIVVLAVVLVLVVAASAAVLFLLPSSNRLGELTATPTPALDAPPGTAAGFDLRVFQRRAYQELNQELIQSGRLPVTAPTGTGKANPFL